MVCVDSFLAEQRMGFAMAEISRRGANQFGDFVRVLELGAVDLDDSARVADQRFGGGLDDPRLSRTRGAEE